MKPTKAQIEAILRDKIRLVARPDYEETETWMVKPGCIESIAAEIAALTAAAEAGGEKAEDRTITNQREVARIKAAAAEAGEQNLREDYKNMTASRDRLWHEKREIEAATIERCAQVAENHHASGFTAMNRQPYDIAAAIRALKEESNVR